MKFQVITLFPQMIEAFQAEGVIGQSVKKNIIQIEVINPRDFTSDTHKTVDDRPFGGGDGMLMMVEPMQKSLHQAIATSGQDPWIVYMSPQGQTLNQEKVLELRQKENLILICGRYGGIDQRIINQFVDEEISIGEYVLSGGELAACVVIDSVARQIPGVLGHAGSASRDSFSTELKGLLEAPTFTRPQDFLGEKVPDILLSGNHGKIQKWRSQISVLTSLLKRPDLLLTQNLSRKEVAELKKFWKELSLDDKKVLGLSALSDEDLELLENEAFDLR